MQECERNGQKDLERGILEPNCERCANFRVRYFCLYDDWDCIPDKRGMNDEKDKKNTKVKSYNDIRLETDMEKLDRLLHKKNLPKSAHVLKQILNAATREVKRNRVRIEE